MKEGLIPVLSCPACHGKLDWTIGKRNGDHIEEAEARCASCAAVYPLREGIGGFLTPDLPRHDLWEEVESGLTVYLREHPRVERELMETPLEELSPADRFFRALVLEERGAFADAREAERAAHAGLYTPEYLACWESQYAYVLEHLASSSDPIVDLASGRCYLVERMAGRLNRPIIATDFSPRVLRRNRRLLEFLGLYERTSLLAFDVRRTPFRDGEVRTMTTNLGLANIEDTGRLLDELRRVLSGELLAIMAFYPEEDEENKKAIQSLGLGSFLYQDTTLELFTAAGFEVELANIQIGRAFPTPKGELLEGAEIDALPVAETDLTWCTLVAR